MKLVDLHLSTRVSNSLKPLGIATLEELAEHRSRDLLRLPHFGKRSLVEIVRLLASRGLALQDGVTS